MCLLLSQAPHWWFASGTTLRRRSKCCTDAAPPQRLPSVWASQQRSLDCHARILTLSVVPPEHVWLRDGPVVVAACKKGEVWLATPSSPQSEKYEDQPSRKTNYSITQKRFFSPTKILVFYPIRKRGHRKKIKGFHGQPTRTLGISKLA